ncbi:MAG: ABC transporter permease [Phycisphaerae bacterium]|jgi:putative ABC transport system permease protein
MRGWLQDLRYGSRVLIRSPGVSAAIIICLALGIGANSAMFSVVYGILLKPLSFADADRLVVVAELHGGQRRAAGVISYANLADLRQQASSFENLAGQRGTLVTLSGVGVPERLRGTIATDGFWSVLGVRPALGRLFQAGEDEPGADNVMVISDACWKNRFGGTPDVIGRSALIDGLSFTIVGVLPPGFAFPLGISDVEIWMTTARDSTIYSNRATQRLRVVGRLRDGVTASQARVELGTIAERLRAEYATANHDWSLEVVPLHDEVVATVRPALKLLFGAVVLVLLIACANVGNMLLARGTARSRELAVHGALGASRWQLMRLFLAESLLLSVVGGLLGVALAAWSGDALRGLLPEQLPRRVDVEVGTPVVLFTLALSVVTALAFGLVPGIQAARRASHGMLTTNRQSAVGRPRSRLRGGLVVCEVGLSVVLLVVTGLLLRSLGQLLDVDPGFNPRNLLTFQLAVPFSEYEDPPARARMYDQLRERLAAVPGVTAVGTSTSLPLVPGHQMLHIRLLDRPDVDPEKMPVVRFCAVSPDYFQTLGVPLLKGRMLDEHDTENASGALLINEAMARKFWPDEDPIGRRLFVGARITDNEPADYEVVGIVRNARDAGLNAGPEPYLYVPYQQLAWPQMYFVLRTAGDPEQLVDTVRREVTELTGDEAPFAMRTLEFYIDRTVHPRRAMTFLLVAFAGAALVLASLGLYGVLSYIVAQRTQEIGLRVALGAQAGQVRGLVLRQAMVLVGIGIVAGLVASLAASRLVSGMLFGVSAADPITFAIAPVVLVVVATLACLVPAWRATRVDPLTALRCE